MNKEYIIKDIEKQFSLADEAFREYEELSNEGKGDVAMSRLRFISANLSYTLERFSVINDGWGLDGMSLMLSRYMDNYLRYIKISNEGE